MDVQPPKQRGLEDPSRMMGRLRELIESDKLPVDWMDEWRKVAALTLGVPYDDETYTTILLLVIDAEKAYQFRDLITFEQIRDQIFAIRQKRWKPELLLIKAWMKKEGLWNSGPTP